jgi:hypothetical protein
MIGECSLHQLIQDSYCSMWSLHQSPSRQHAWVVFAFCKSVSLGSQSLLSFS